MLSGFTLADLCETIREFPASIAVFSVEPDDSFVIRAMSPSLESLYGVPAGGADDLSVDEFRFDEQTRRNLKGAYIRARDTRSQVTLDEQIKSLDGNYIWTSRTVVPLVDPKGEVIALLSTVVDITELVETRRALVRTLSTAASGFATLCAWCRKIREEDKWVPLDEYVSAHPESDVVTCPECRAAGEG